MPCNWKFPPGENFIFFASCSHGRIFILHFFCPMFIEYIEPMVIFTASVKIYSVKNFYMVQVNYDISVKSSRDVRYLLATEPRFLDNKQGLYAIFYFPWGKTFSMKIFYFEFLQMYLIIHGL